MRRRQQREFKSWLSYIYLCSYVYLEGGARDMFVAPANDYNIITPFSHYVVHLIVVSPHVFDENFFARSFGPVNSNVEDVVSLKTS